MKGSSEEFVGESVGVNPGVNPPTSRGDSPMRPSENQHKNLAKKEEQEAFCALPLVGAEQDASEGD